MKVKYFGTPAEVYVKEPRIVDHTIRYVRDRGTALQAGAHVGVWPNRIQTYFSRVVAFEPKFESWRAAAETFDLSRTLLINGALGAEEDVVRIHGGPFNGSSQISAGQGDAVTMYTVDSLPEWLWAGLGAIFLDVEGYEMQILYGAEKTIRRTLPVVVLESGGKWDEDDLLVPWLIAHKYKLAERVGRDIILVPE